MGHKLYVGNLSFSVDETALQTIFAEAGNVSSAKIITPGLLGGKRQAAPHGAVANLRRAHVDARPMSDERPAQLCEGSSAPGAQSRRRSLTRVCPTPRRQRRPRCPRCRRTRHPRPAR